MTPNMPLVPRAVAAALFAGLFLAAAAPVTSAAGASRVFRAGAATSNITPPLGTSINGGFQDGKAAHIHDELHARCLVLDDGTTRLALVVVDNCVIERGIFDAAKRRVQEATGLPMGNMLMSATHAHSCGTLTAVGQSDPDPAYQAFVAQRIADGVRRALNNLEPAKIGWGFGAVPQHVHNRRWHTQPGTIPPDPFGGTTDQVRMNPGFAHASLLRPAGPADPQVWFLSVQSAAGRPLALYASYSLHYVGGVGPGHISADYFGAFADRIQQLLGADRQSPAFVGMMANGTSGDINSNDYGKTPPKYEPYEKIRRVADDVAQEVLRVSRSLTYHDWVPLGVANAELPLRLRLPTPAEVEKAHRVVRASKDYPRMVTREESYARETVKLADFPAQVSAPLQVLKIGTLRVAAIPAEVFVEIGLELKRRHPESFTVSLANAYHGYLPTPEQHRLGGYETWRARSSCLEVDASTKIVATLDGLFTKLR